MQFLQAVSDSMIHAQPLQTTDDSADEPDPADNDAGAENATTSTAVGSVYRHFCLL